MAEQQEAQASGLFAIFLLAMYSLVLVPYTLYALCSRGEEKAQAVVKVRRACLPCVCMCGRVHVFRGVASPPPGTRA